MKHPNCTACSEPIITKPRLYRAEPYCDTCYEEKFSECSECHELFPNDDMNPVDEGLCCEACFDSAYTLCWECNDTIRLENARDINGHDMCESCADNYIQCESCSEYVVSDDSYYSEQLDRYYCGDCYHERHDTCPGCSYTFLNEDLNEDGYCEDCSENEHSLSSYHSLDRKWTKEASKSRFRCGVEVEKEDGNVEIDSSYYYEKYNWCLEEDGSLANDIGFEAVSPVLPLDFKYHKHLRRYLEQVKELINAEHSGSCGGHIHLSDKKRKPIEIARDIRGYMPLLYALYPSRCKNHYSQERTFKNIFYSPAEHCSAFNVTNNTCEVRIFPSPKNLNVLIWRLELLHLMLMHTRRYANEVVEDIQHKNALYLHLRQVYSDERIQEKLALMGNYPEFFKI